MSPGTPRVGTVLAFDFGLARIGVAVGETETGNAHPLTAIAEEVNAVRFAAIEALLAEWKPASLVVGLPTHLDGSEHAMTARCRRFANQLEQPNGLGAGLDTITGQHVAQGADQSEGAGGVKPPDWGHVDALQAVALDGGGQPLGRVAGGCRRPVARKHGLAAVIGVHQAKVGGAFHRLAS